MPGFVRTKADEKKWSRAKDAAAKETERGSEGFWKLSNYIFHKTEGNHEVAEFWKGELLQKGPPTGGGFAFGVGKESAKSEMKKFGGMGQLSLGESTNVKIPKQKHMPGPDAKPSVFFKQEACVEPKHPTLRKLRDFLLNKKRE